MFKLLQAGFTAALLQTIACVLAVPLAGLTASPDASGENTVLALRWSLLAVALGLSLTANRFVDATTTQMRWASRRSGMSLTPLVSALGFAAVGFFALALRPPPEPFQGLADSLLGAPASLIVWPALMSIGVAAFGAGTHAAVRADKP